LFDLGQNGIAAAFGFCDRAEIAKADALAAPLDACLERPLLVVGAERNTRRIAAATQGLTGHGGDLVCRASLSHLLGSGDQDR
jgi:hypothetical protein